MLDSGDYVTIDDLTYSYEGKQTRLTAQKKTPLLHNDMLMFVVG